MQIASLPTTALASWHANATLWPLLIAFSADRHVVCALMPPKNILDLVLDWDAPNG